MTSTTPAGFFDVLDFLVMKDGVRQANSMDGSYDVLTSPDATGRFLRVRIKNDKCTKFDIDVVTNTTVYDRSTTVDDGNPRNVKLHMEPNGYPKFPRYIPNIPSFRVEQPVIAAANSTFNIYNDCKPPAKPNMLGYVKQVLSGVFHMDLPGFGSTPCLLHEFFYNGFKSGDEIVYKSLERNTLAQYLGWVKWELMGNFKDGMLYQIQSSVHAKLNKTTPPKFIFPCTGVKL